MTSENRFEHAPFGTLVAEQYEKAVDPMAFEDMINELLGMPFDIRSPDVDTVGMVLAEALCVNALFIARSIGYDAKLKIVKDRGSSTRQRGWIVDHIPGTSDEEGTPLTLLLLFGALQYGREVETTSHLYRMFQGNMLLANYGFAAGVPDEARHFLRPSVVRCVLAHKAMLLGCTPADIANLDNGHAS